MRLKTSIFALSAIVGCSRAMAVNLKITAKSDIKNLLVYSLQNGDNKLIIHKQLSNGENVEFSDPTYKGVFTFFVADAYHYCYLTDDKNVTIEVTENEVKISETSPLNERLDEWSRIIKDGRKLSVEFYKSTNEQLKNYDDCFNKLNTLRETSHKFLEKCKSLDKESYEIVKNIVESDIDVSYLGYILSPGIAASIVVPQDVTDFLISDNKFVSDNLLQHYPEIGRYVHYYLRFVRNAPKNGSRTELDHLTSDRIKADYLLAKAKSYKKYSEYENMVAKHGHLFVTDGEKKRLAALGQSLQAMKSGSPGYNFALQDVEGNVVKLSDLKGKLVYVDVWATWCGPCKREIPFMKTLEEKFHGKDVAFVSISTDKNPEAWKSFVKSQKMAGIQLIDKDNSMAKHYNFNSIPYFILFDKNGNLVQADAPRPSSGAEALIFKHLKNKP